MNVTINGHKVIAGFASLSGTELALQIRAPDSGRLYNLELDLAQLGGLPSRPAAGDRSAAEREAEFEAQEKARREAEFEAQEKARREAAAAAQDPGDAAPPDPEPPAAS